MSSYYFEIPNCLEHNTSKAVVSDRTTPYSKSVSIELSGLMDWWSDVSYGTVTISGSQLSNKQLLFKKEFTPKHIYFSKSAGTTVVLWEDGTKTVVKCTYKDNFCEDQGFAMALAKKVFGNRNSYMKYVENGVDQDKEKQKKNKKKPDNVAPLEDNNYE